MNRLQVKRSLSAGVWIRQCGLLLLLLALAVLTPWLWLCWPPSSVSALLWRDYATLATWLVLAVGLLLMWRRRAVVPLTTPRLRASTRSASRLRPDGHRWLGVVLAVPLSWLLLSGSLTLYRAELDLWLTPELRASSALHQGALEALPHDMPAQQLAAAQQLQVAQQFLLATPSAQAAHSWYIEFASARKPYITLHWPAPAATSRFTLNRQYLTLQGQPLGSVRLVQPGEQRQTFGGLVFDVHYTLLGRVWLEPFKRYLADGLPPSVVAWLPTGLGICASVALAWCVFSFSGLALSWRLYRRAPAQVLPAPGGVHRQGALRWHLWLGVLLSPWLLWYGISAVVMQLGNWREVPPTLSTAEYYAALFPQPPRPAVAATSFSSTGFPVTSISASLDRTPLNASQLQALVARWPHWPVGKVTWHSASADSPAYWQLSPSGSAQWPQTPSGVVNPTSLALQRLDDGRLSTNDTAAVSRPWQWRHHLYQLHQSFYLAPWGRAVMAGLGMLAWLSVVLAVWRWQRQRPSVARRALLALMLEAPLAGLVLAAIWFTL